MANLNFNDGVMFGVTVSSALWAVLVLAGAIILGLV